MEELRSPAALHSITWRGLDSLLGELNIPALDLREWQLPAFNTHDLRPILLERGIYPARDFPHLIEQRPPDLFVTYDWREQILSVRATIWRALEYCLSSQQGRGVDLEDVAANGVSFWLDWVFIDQSSRNVDQELDLILPVLFKESAVHLVASVTALTRAWCCYELAQFNRRAAANKSNELTSLIPGDSLVVSALGGSGFNRPRGQGQGRKADRRGVSRRPQWAGIPHGSGGSGGGLADRYRCRGGSHRESSQPLGETVQAPRGLA